jgi:hypothetical protein
MTCCLSQQAAHTKRGYGARHPASSITHMINKQSSLQVSLLQSRCIYACARQSDIVQCAIAWNEEIMECA